jgi:hypothetical protein
MKPLSLEPTPSGERLQMWFVGLMGKKTDVTIRQQGENIQCVRTFLTVMFDNVAMMMSVIRCG